MSTDPDDPRFPYYPGLKKTVAGLTRILDAEERRSTSPSTPRPSPCPKRRGGPMATELIDLEAKRRERRPSYVNRPNIETHLSGLEDEVRNITVGSVAAFGAIDLLAYEVLAHINAIRRALDAAAPDEEGRG